MDMATLLKVMCDRQASDLFITAGAAPTLKINGEVNPLSKQALNAEQSLRIIHSLLSTEQKQAFTQCNDLNFVLEHPQLGRFRVNVHKHQNQSGMVIRRIKTDIPSMEDLLLPEVYKELIMEKQGLVLICGSTDSGKSTTLASMIDYRNQHSKGHILAIEEPIEFIHRSQSCIVTQREIGVDIDNYEAALQNAMRQSPDVVVIGEIRSAQAMQQAIQFAQTGQLCVATLHASNTQQALERIVKFFPSSQSEQVLYDISTSLLALITQKLVPTQAGKRRVVCETLLNTALAAQHIRQHQFDKLQDLIKRNLEFGMSSFENMLFDLVHKGVIDSEVALKFADRSNELRLMIKLREHEHYLPPNVANMKSF